MGMNDNYLVKRVYGDRFEGRGVMGRCNGSIEWTDIVERGLAGKGLNVLRVPHLGKVDRFLPFMDRY